MKKFYSVICSICAIIQALFFWILVYGYTTTEQVDSVGRAGFYIIMILGLFILSLIDKLIRGLKGWMAILLDMILSPIRFLAQLIVGILCLANKVDVKRGKYDEYNKLETFDIQIRFFYFISFICATFTNNILKLWMNKLFHCILLFAIIYL